MGRYQQIERIKSEGKKEFSGRIMYTTVKYPSIPFSNTDIYVYAEEGDRYDQLANTYYGDPSLWWIISIANDNLYQNSLTPPVGTQIRIPSNQAPIISAYKSINS